MPPAVKEVRCATCKRPHAAKLAECPFCARDRAAGVEPAAFGATRRQSLRPKAGDDDTTGSRWVGSALLFGVPLLLGAIWGVVELVYTTPLGGEESSPSSAISVVAALFIAPLLAILFVRRAQRTLADAIENLGISTTIIIGFVATGVAFIPAVLFVTGCLQWWNGMGADVHPRIVECNVGSVWHPTRKGTDMGWSVSYTCDVEGDHLVGTIGGLAAAPNVTEGGPIHFRAARGRLGRWLRLGEPVPEGTPLVP